MVFFQCQVCFETLKKKQIENHYLYQCKNSYDFMCIDCQQIFNRETIKEHTSCVSEKEKYEYGDNMKKKNNIKQIEKKIIKFNINELKWHGFRKTSKIILMGYENYKLNINELIDKLSIVYVKKFNEIPENFDKIKAKKILIEKLENNRYFVIDLGKNTIKYKP